VQHPLILTLKKCPNLRTSDFDQINFMCYYIVKQEMDTRGIKNWPEDDRPREKLFKFGEHTLSNSELLAILLGTGHSGESAVDLGRRILNKFKNLRNLSHIDLNSWREFKGIGKTKLARIRAAIEIGRRFMTEERKIEGKISSPRGVAELVMPRMRDLKKEIFKVILLDAKNNIITTVEIEEGTVTQATPYIREIIFPALQNFAAGVICLHNHPSGDPQPSQEDREFTLRLKKATEVMQIKLVDHIIIGDNNYYSFAEVGII
jgi:DNA repair protein RadC